MITSWLAPSAEIDDRSEQRSDQTEDEESHEGLLPTDVDLLEEEHRTDSRDQTDDERQRRGPDRVALDGHHDQDRGDPGPDQQQEEPEEGPAREGIGVPVAVALGPVDDDREDRQQQSTQCRLSRIETSHNFSQLLVDGVGPKTGCIPQVRSSKAVILTIMSVKITLLLLLWVKAMSTNQKYRTIEVKQSLQLNKP